MSPSTRASSPSSRSASRPALPSAAVLAADAARALSDYLAALILFPTCSRFHTPCQLGAPPREDVDAAERAVGNYMAAMILFPTCARFHTPCQLGRTEMKKE